MLVGASAPVANEEKKEEETKGEREEKGGKEKKRRKEREHREAVGRGNMGREKYMM